jgi:hypothetical protein
MRMIHRPGSHRRGGDYGEASGRTSRLRVASQLSRREIRNMREHGAEPESIKLAESVVSVLV